MSVYLRFSTRPRPQSLHRNRWKFRDFSFLLPLSSLSKLSRTCYSLEIDHLSLATVVSSAKLFLAKETALHGLANNAGIMATTFRISKEGHEAQWQTNYLAPWVFISRLLPLMLKASKGLPSRSVHIVNLSSSGHYSAPKGGINFSDTSLPDASNLTHYDQSKLANVLHTKTLNQLYGPDWPSAAAAGNGEIWTTAAHPGLIESNLGVKAEMPSGFLWNAIKVYGGRVVGGMETGVLDEFFLCSEHWDME